MSIKALEGSGFADRLVSASGNETLVGAGAKFLTAVAGPTVMSSVGDGTGHHRQQPYRQIIS
ncbi:hypothetical protein [Azospirillum sp. B506]|uniref:hypothetical protein n=1 Tax=Azospirillum sp. B506 TaxID=137721 RepID=UPI000344AE0E|nr:hypothetical protein [Azospirillum sp. B506]